MNNNDLSPLPPLPENLIVVHRHQLRKAPWNYKEEDADMTAKLIANFKRNGQLLNLNCRTLVGQTTDDGLQLYEIGDGNHRLDVLYGADLPHAWIFDHGDVSEEELVRLAIEINETRFDTNYMKLGALLKLGVARFGMEDLAETQPFDAERIQALIDLKKWRWPDEDPHEPEDPSADPPSEWYNMTLTMPTAVFKLWQQACLRIHSSLKAEGHDVHADPEIRKGQFFEVLLAEFMAG